LTATHLNREGIRQPPDGGLPIGPWLLLGGVLLLFAIIIGWDLYAEYKAVDTGERERLAAQSRVMNENLAQQLLSTSRLLDSIRSELPFLRAQRDGNALVDRRLQASAKITPGLRALFIFDATGFTVNCNRNELIGENFGGRDYFQVPRRIRNPDLLHVTAPFKSFSGAYTMTVSKVILDERGEFAGVAAATLEPNFFKTLLSSILYAEDMRAAVIHGDGKVIFRIPDPQGAVGIDLAEKPETYSRYAHHMQSGGKTSIFSGVGGLTGEDRLTIFSTLRPETVSMDKPLVTTVSRHLPAVFASWYREIFLQLALFGAIALMCLGGLLYYRRRLSAYNQVISRREAERGHAEQALKRSEDIFRKAFYLSPDMCSISQIESGRYVLVSRSFAELLGYTEEELVGKTSFELNIWEDAESRKPLIELLRKDGMVMNYAVRFRTKDGDVRSGLMSAATIDIEAIPHLMCVTRDMTGQLASQEALARESYRNQAFLRNASDGVHIMGGDGVLLEASDSFCMMLGYAREELIGAHVSLWDAQWSTQDLKQKIAEQIRAVGRSVFETRHRRRDGSVFDVEISGQALELDGRLVLFNSARDITERKKFETELMAAKQNAEAANLAKSRFLASASHDLRQPIQAINLFSLALNNTALSQEQKKISDYLALSAKSLGDLLNALLDISKFDAGLVKPVHELVGTRTLIRNLSAEVTLTASAKQLRFRVSTRRRELASHTDPKLLRSLLGNLIDNAIKYTERGGVLVGIRRRGRQILIQVWDTGIGIAPENMNAIFDEYFQIENRERDRSKGLGLGLAIAKRIARLLGSEVTCRSRPGKGSVFEFRLPLAGESPEQIAKLNLQPGAGRIAARDMGERRVAVIEDDWTVAMAMKLSLESVGMRVNTYDNAEIALASPDIGDADFYICDLRLPGLNGPEFLDALQRQSQRRVRGVILTGDTSPERVELVRSSGWPVMFKPIDLPALLSTIKSLETVH
jgi:PAS domain S-box-containing protein